MYSAFVEIPQKNLWVSEANPIFFAHYKEKPRLSTFLYGVVNPK